MVNGAPKNRSRTEQGERKDTRRQTDETKPNLALTNW